MVIRFETTGWEVATDDEYMPGHVNAKLVGLKVPPISKERYREFKIRLREEIIEAALDSGSEYMEYAKEGGPSYPNMWIEDSEDYAGGSGLSSQENLNLSLKLPTTAAMMLLIR